MPQSTDDHIGARIASHRKLAGYTQQTLADHANLSLGVIRKVERGERLPTAGVLSAVASTLHVTVEDLTGQPYRHQPQDERVHAPIAAIRTALRHWDLPGDWFERPRPLHLLQPKVRDALRYRSAGHLTRLGRALPPLLEELTAAVHLHDGREQRQAARMLAFAYDMTHTLTYRLGYPDLRGQVEDRLRWAADLSGDPLMRALAEFARVETFKSAHEYDAGLRVLRAARERLADEATARGPEYLTVMGGMRLRDVTLASRASDADATVHHLRRAKDLLKQLPSEDDQTHYCLVFGKGNLSIHEIQARLELQHLDMADVAISEAVMPKTVPPTRVSAFHIHVARVDIAADRREKALSRLQQARKVAPQITRYNPMARDAALLLSTQYRRTTEELRALTTWLGVGRQSN